MTLGSSASQRGVFGVPPGLHMACFTGPNSPAPKGGPSDTCPVIQTDGLTVWPYGYADQRSSMGIVAYDSARRQVQQWEKPGARYVWKITTDPAARTVTFWGQANGTIVMAWADLRGSPTIASLPAQSIPGIPRGLHMACFTGPSRPTGRRVGYVSRHPVRGAHILAPKLYRLATPWLSSHMTAADTSFPQTEQGGARYV